jgi:hypothetical protein
MRILASLIAILTSFVLHGQSFTQSEVEAYAAIRVENALLVSDHAENPPPGLDSSEMSFERYGEIIRQGLIGDEVELTSQDSIALQMISAAVKEEEEHQRTILIRKHGLTIERYDQLDELLKRDRKFAEEYRRVIISMAENRID